MTRIRDTPHVSRFRLFERRGQRYLCRVCGERFQDGNLERHARTEVRKRGEAEIIRMLHLRLTKRGKARLKRRTQFYHERAMYQFGAELDPRREQPEVLGPRRKA